MAGKVSLSLVIHIHQPVGNFDSVVEQAYQDAYAPFLEALEEYATMPHTLHVSGCLFEWLEQHHPEYLERLQRLVRTGRIELMAGGFYEPIFTMLPADDRREQLAMMLEYLKKRFGVAAETAWVPERVWEQQLARDFADAGIKAVVVDDFHFLAAGLSRQQLSGYYVTEEQGRLLSVFPGSETLRYLVPFHPVEEVIEYLEGLRSLERPLVVYADDGEKFGVWPGTRKHVFDDGWLRRFYQALEENRGWLEVLPLKSALSRSLPAGKIYLPDCSYREMTEWALPARSLSVFRSIEKELRGFAAFQSMRPFIRGGTWRNFRHKYPEIDWMYARMLAVSEATRKHRSKKARRSLLRSQCNCAWWHGIFGGFYLPHLRAAIWQEILAAENACAGKQQAGIEVADFDLDTNEEARLYNRHLNLFVDPHGGMVREIDVREKRVNLSDTLARRYEAYHDIVTEGPGDAAEGAASIHEVTPLKEPGLAEHLTYDRQILAGFMDFTAASPPSARQLRRNEAGVFLWAGLEYDCEYSEDDKHLRVVFEREENIEVTGKAAVRLVKEVALERGRPVAEVAVTIEPYGLQAADGHCAATYGLLSYFNLLSDAGAERGIRVGASTWGLASEIATEGGQLLLYDAFRGISLLFSCLEGGPAQWRAFPVHTVSSSEAGLEKVYQATGIACMWHTPLRRYEPVRRRIRLEIVDGG